MHDSVELEIRGVPTAAVITTAFQQEASAQLAALGMDGFRPVIIDHPLSTLSQAEIDDRAGEAMPLVIKTFLGTEG